MTKTRITETALLAILVLDVMVWLTDLLTGRIGWAFVFVPIIAGVFYSYHLVRIERIEAEHRAQDHSDVW